MTPKLEVPISNEKKSTRNEKISIYCYDGKLLSITCINKSQIPNTSRYFVKNPSKIDLTRSLLKNREETKRTRQNISLSKQNYTPILFLSTVKTHIVNMHGHLSSG